MLLTILYTKVEKIAMVNLPKFSFLSKKAFFGQNYFTANGNTEFETSKIWREKHEVHNSNGLRSGADRDASFRL